MSTNPRDFYAPSTIKNLLLTSIDSVVSNINCYTKSPDVDFTRVRKITADTLIKFILLMSTDKSMNSNLFDYFTLAYDLPSQSAMCQRRNLLYPDALRSVMRLFTDNMENLKTFNGYCLLACDGSDINVPYNPDDMETFHPGNDDSRGYNQLHLNALYDVCNHIYQDIQIDTHTKKNETYALDDMIKMYNYPDNSVIICDRSYEKYNLFALCTERNQKFLIRIKDISSNGILSTMNLVDTEFDIDITKTLTRLQTNEVKAHPEKYVRLMTNCPDFEYLKIEDDCYDLPLRIVRFKITEDTYECLATNLSREEFPFEVMKELYHRRWNIEESFKTLKYAIGADSFNSKKQNSIRQEIYAKVILYNFSSFIINNTVIDQPSDKCKINFHVAVTNIRSYLKNEIDETNLTAKTKKFLTLIRPGRTYERRLKPKHATPLAYKHS